MKKILLGILCLSTLILCSCEKQNPQNDNDIDIIDTDVISTQDPAEDTIVCTADVYECPDGSYVSRHGPNCEFDPCPTDNVQLGNETEPQGDESMSSGGSETTGGYNLDSSLQEDTTDIDEIIQKYENNEEFDENGVDMLYEIIQSLEGN